MKIRISVGNLLMGVDSFLMMLGLNRAGCVIMHRGFDVGIINEERSFLRNGIEIDAKKFPIVKQNAEKLSDLFQITYLN